MWIVVKYDKKKIGSLINELKVKFNNNLKIYNPKFKAKFRFKNKTVENELSLLGDYLFCYHKNFNNPYFVNILKFTKGVKNLKDVPTNAKKYISGLEKFIETKVSSISTSPERNDTILIEDPFKN